MAVTLRSALVALGLKARRGRPKGSKNRPKDDVTVEAIKVPSCRHCGAYDHVTERHAVVAARDRSWL